jgi:threonylcarbamoyladenosine tRNA methylthiotransferase MtaB
MKYSILTFGCRVNQADSFEIERQLMATGATAAPPHEAELVVINSCSVTGAADQSARQMVRKIARENPSARIVVTGCYATRWPDEIGGLPAVVQIVPNNLKERFADEVGLTTAERFGAGDGSCGAAVHPGVAGRTAYTLRVQTGCDQTCAYCIIPTTRGAGRSRPSRDIAADIERIRREGYQEVVLTGVHLGSYGRDLADGSSLTSLLELAAQRAGEMLFRISSLEPMDCSDEIVDLVARSRTLAPHFHLPLQHASDRMLVAMRRPYTLAYYRRLVDRIRERMPHASIGSDLIVGFPGETDADFRIVDEYLQMSPLTHVHVFPYSDRDGTAAARMSQKVNGTVIRERAARLRAIGRRLQSKFYESQSGQIRRALTIDDGTTAVTDNYLKVRIPPGRSRNEWIDVAVTVDGDSLLGTVLSTA